MTTATDKIKTAIDNMKNTSGQKKVPVKAPTTVVTHPSVAVIAKTPVVAAQVTSTQTIDNGNTETHMTSTQTTTTHNAGYEFYDDYSDWFFWIVVFVVVLLIIIIIAAAMGAGSGGGGYHRTSYWFGGCGLGGRGGRSTTTTSTNVITTRNKKR